MAWARAPPTIDLTSRATLGRRPPRPAPTPARRPVPSAERLTSAEPERLGDHPRRVRLVSHTTRILIANLPDNVQIDNGIILGSLTNYEALSNYKLDIF